MRLSRSLICCLLALSTFVPRWAQAEPIDSSAARELLKQGYALKQDGKYAEALERLVESLRLDSQIKTLINIADCEESLGMLSQAQKHWILARDQASLQGAQPQLAEAEKRLAALETRMPRLVVNRIGPAIEGIEIHRDGVLLEGVALGVALPTDPGKHEVLVTALGHAERRYTIDLVEKDSRVLDVAPGPANSLPIVAAPVPPKAPAVSQPAPTDTTIAGPTAGISHSSIWNAQRVIAVGAAGLGVIGLGLAEYSWSHANSQHDEARATCNPNCTEEGRQKQADAVSSVHLTSAMLIAGSVLIAGSAVLWFTAPESGSPTVGLAPIAGPSEAGLSAAGTF
jgi:hypothetical protein